MKKTIWLYLSHEKMEFIPSSETKCPKASISYWWDESGKAVSVFNETLLSTT